MTRQILVHDDDDDLVRRYTRKLGELNIWTDQFTISPLWKDDFVDEMQVLIERQRSLRKDGTRDQVKSELDKTSILVVDFDLVESNPKAEWNSEDVAYLVRSFSDCGVVIGLNLRGCAEFDLTLRDHVDSYADLNIVAQQLHNIGLWQGKSERDKFRPWYWPPMLHFVDRFEDKVKAVQQHFNEPICDVLGIRDVAKFLPASISEFLRGDDPLKTTFKDFVMHSPRTFRAKEKNLSEQAMCRMAAARISSWLENRLLPGQDIVVDAPHLVMRYPSLLDGNTSELDTWNKTASFVEFDQLGIKHSMIEEYRFKESIWISRPVWFWRKLVQSESIKEIVAPWQKEPSKFVFCEDASMFYERDLCKAWDADVDSPYVRRYVRYFAPDIDYQPRMKIL